MRDTVLGHEGNPIAAAWDGADTNEQATENLLAMMRSDPAVYQRVMAPHERQAAGQAVAQFKRARRRYIWSRPSGPDARVAALARSNAVSLFDMRLPSGRRLGDARRADIEDAAQSYRDLADHNASKARFFFAIAERLTGNRRVAEALTVADLEELRHAK